MIGESKYDLKETYELNKQLGCGSYSIVFEARHRHSGELRCIKKIGKENFTKEEEESIMNEIAVLRETDHPHIIKIMEYYQNERNLYIVMERLEGGELFDRIIELKCLNESYARILMRQILSAVSYLHKKNIVHRDIKPENLMLETKKPDSHLKLIDFGTSRRYRADQKLKAKMGTPYYIAPEVLNKNYDEKCDIWSCGVIMYILLCGYPPFNGKNDDAIFEKIKTGKFEFPKEDWNKISPEAKELIKQMLVLDTKKRFSAQQCLDHPWLKRADTLVNPEEKSAALKNLLYFKAENQLQRAIMLYFVTFYDLKEEKKKLTEVFKSLDKDGDGTITKEELVEGLKRAGDKFFFTDRQIDQVFKELDLNDTKAIDFSEFLVANYNYQSKLNNKKLRELFDQIDEDKNGQISADELTKFFRFSDENSEEFVKNMIKEVDTDRNGSISFLEFEKAMKNLADSKSF